MGKFLGKFFYTALKYKIEKIINNHAFHVNENTFKTNTKVNEFLEKRPKKSKFTDTFVYGCLMENTNDMS